MAEVSIDTSTIEGYAEMSVEDKLAALESYKFNDVSADLAAAQEENRKLKDATNKATHDRSVADKELKALKAQVEKGEGAKDSALADLQAKYDTLVRKNTVSEYKASLVAQGYDMELASETAEAMADGDMNKVFENNQKFIEAHDKAIKADLLKQTPRPGTGGTGDPGTSAMTAEKFGKLTTEEQIAFKNEHPDAFRKLLGK